MSSFDPRDRFRTCLSVSALDNDRKFLLSVSAELLFGMDLYPGGRVSPFRSELNRFFGELS